MKATKRPRINVLRWALVDRRGQLRHYYGNPMHWHTRSTARLNRAADERVVLVRVTVEVVE